MQPINDNRLSSLQSLISPSQLKANLPLSPALAQQITQARDEACRILSGQDDRLLLVIGPCSIHDPTVGLEYGMRLKTLIDQYRADLHIVMRTYFEKPRTVRGWKGLINDPYLNKSFDINHGLHLARQLLLDLTEKGINCGTEFLDTIIPQFLADIIVWAAIGARTTESQIHRELASGLSMPVGFKNGTHGSVQVAVEAIRAARHPHHFLSVNQEGLAAIFSTAGNANCHVILRGSHHTPNYDAEHIHLACEQLAKHHAPANLMVDCSHGNSYKNHRNQSVVVHDLANQLKRGSRYISGVMIESFLQAGRQDLVLNKPLVHGQSITDACIGWEETCELVGILSDAVKERRKFAI